MTGVKRRLYTDSDICALHKELDEVSCPICMDHPHNAVLLLCSSHDKGCRSYICDTSYRHSNCFDRFKKERDNDRDTPTVHNPLNPYNSDGGSDVDLAVQTRPHDPSGSNQNEISTVLSVGLPQVSRLDDTQDSSHHISSHNQGIYDIVDSVTLRERVEIEESDEGGSSDSKLSLKCPLCRGAVLGWEVVEEARTYLNLKRRSCSRESCLFVGNYHELRRHARRVHPTTHPSDIDPSRERAWRHLERQREYGDIVSAIHSAMPGAVVVGDYVIENGDGRVAGGREGGVEDSNGPWLTTLFLFQMFGSIESVREPRARSRAWTRHRRSTGSSSGRRYLWGENLLGLRDEERDDDLRLFNEVGEDESPVPRRRRRLNQSRSNEDQL